MVQKSTSYFYEHGTGHPYILSPNAFSSMADLRVLNISSEYFINEFKSGCFNGLDNLEELNVCFCELDKIENEHVFSIEISFFMNSLRKRHVDNLNWTFLTFVYMYMVTYTYFMHCTEVCACAQQMRRQRWWEIFKKSVVKHL